jgi:protein subunit release factor B
LEHTIQQHASKEQALMHQIAALEADVQKNEDSKSKEEEREGKLKALLSKTKKSFNDTRQLLTLKETECAELQSKVLLLHLSTPSDAFSLNSNQE